MKYLQGRKFFDIRVMEQEPQKPECNEVLVRVLTCGVCGSDIHLLKHVGEYTALGHEIAAEVVEIGVGVNRVRIGDTVIVEDMTMCGVCRDCKNGDTNLCKNMYTLNEQSGIGEYLTVRENALVPYAGMDALSACLTEPLAVSLNTYLAAKLPPNGTLVIYGLGILGIMCARLAKHYGAAKVIGVGSCVGSNRNKVREATMLQMGADVVLYASDTDIEHAVQKILGGRKADAVIVTSPPSTVPSAMRSAKYGGNIVVIGLDMGENTTAEIDIDQLIFNKHTLVPVYAEPSSMLPLSIELLKQKIVDAEQLVTHTFGIDEVDKLKELYLDDKPVIKAVLKNK